MKSLLLMMLLSGTALANESVSIALPATESFPRDELAFVDVVEQWDQQTVLAKLGEPAHRDDVYLKDTDQVVGSVWYYRNLNTNQNGVTYPVTEIDFVDDAVVTVVFMSSDTLADAR